MQVTSSAHAHRLAPSVSCRGPVELPTQVVVVPADGADRAVDDLTLDRVAAREVAVLVEA